MAKLVSAIGLVVLAIVLTIAAVPYGIAAALRTMSTAGPECSGNDSVPEDTTVSIDSSAPAASTSTDTTASDTSASASGCTGGMPPSGPGGNAGPVAGSAEMSSVKGSCTGWFTVHRDIAVNIESLLNAACTEGIVLGGWAWRSAEAQIALRKAHCGPTNYDIYDKPSSQCSPPTARPGNSMHERGKAIDFASGGVILGRSGAAFAWLAQHAAQFGLYNLPSEPWHWSTNGR